MIPTPKFSVGSTGNLWVIPKGSKNPELAKEFISLLLSAKYQTEQANNGGVSFAADAGEGHQSGGRQRVGRVRSRSPPSRASASIPTGRCRASMMC